VTLTLGMFDQVILGAPASVQLRLPVQRLRARLQTEDAQ